MIPTGLAARLRRFPGAPGAPARFPDLLASNTRAPSHNQDVRFPWTGEYCDGQTGVWRTAECDNNHSTDVDVVVAAMAGLRPGPDCAIEVRQSITAEPPAFMVDGVCYDHRDVTTLWKPVHGEPMPHDGLIGYHVYIDGALAHCEVAATPSRVALPSRQRSRQTAGRRRGQSPPPSRLH